MFSHSLGGKHPVFLCKRSGMIFSEV